MQIGWARFFTPENDPMTESTSSRSRRDFLKASTATAASLSRLDTFPKHLDMEEPALPSPGVTKLI